MASLWQFSGAQLVLASDVMVTQWTALGRVNVSGTWAREEGAEIIRRIEAVQYLPTCLPACLSARLPQQTGAGHKQTLLPWSPRC